MDRISRLRLILTDKEEKSSEDKDFIEYLISKRPEERFIVFDKKDIALKIDIDEVKIKMPKLKFYSKLNVKIDDKIKSNNIIEMLEHIPSHLELRLETNNIDQIIELIRSKILIEMLNEQGIKFLYKGIEISPRIIENIIDEKDVKNEVKEIEAKRDRLNTDCDE